MVKITDKEKIKAVEKDVQTEFIFQFIHSALFRKHIDSHGLTC